MRKLLLTTALAAIPIAVAAPPFGNVNAASTCGTATDCIYDPITDTTYFDPTSFHVTATGATGSDPVLLNNKTAFSIQDIGGLNISQPLTIFIAGPVGSVAPTISSTTYTSPSNVTTSVSGALARTLIGTDTGINLYTFVGCVACDNSLNFTNINAALVADGLPSATSLTVWSFSVPQGFVGHDEVNVTGAFANGDIVFPFAENGAGTNTITVFDTSWTNTGFVDCPPGPTCTVSPPPPPPPPPPPVPEPSTIGILGLGALGILALRRKFKPQVKAE
jgi:hypothetical protein